MSAGPRLVWKAFRGAGGHFDVEDGDAVLEAEVLPSEALSEELLENARPRLARCVGDQGLIGYVLRLWVPHGRRGRGLGRRMMELALGKFRELGARAAVLRAIPSQRSDLQKLLRFYERLGFHAAPECQDVGEPYPVLGLLLEDLPRGS